MSPENLDLLVRFLFAFVAIDLVVLISFLAGWTIRGSRGRRRDHRGRAPDGVDEEPDKRQARETVEKLAREQFPTLAGQ